MNHRFDHDLGMDIDCEFYFHLYLSLDLVLCRLLTTDFIFLLTYACDRIVTWTLTFMTT